MVPFPLGELPSGRDAPQIPATLVCGILQHPRAVPLAWNNHPDHLHGSFPFGPLLRDPKMVSWLMISLNTGSLPHPPIALNTLPAFVVLQSTQLT